MSKEVVQHRHKKSISDRLLKYFAILVFVFLFIPVVVIFVYSFNDGKLLVSFNAFGFSGYEALFKKPAVTDAVFVSLKVGVISAFFATLLGTLAGIGLARKPGKWAFMFISFLLLVAVTPDIVDAVALLPWLVFLGQDAGLGIFNDGLSRLVIANSIFSVAVVTYIVRARLLTCTGA